MYKTLTEVFKENPRYKRGFVYMGDGGAKAMDEFRMLLADGVENSLAGSGRIVLADISAARYHDLNRALTKSWTWRYDHHNQPLNPEEQYSRYENHEVLIIDPLHNRTPEQKAKAEKYAEILKSGHGFIDEFEGKTQKIARNFAKFVHPDNAEEAREYLKGHSSIPHADLEREDIEVIKDGVHLYAMDTIGFRAFRYPTEAPEEEAGDLSASFDLSDADDIDIDIDIDADDTGPRM